jgi:hypothetical protein
MGRDGLPVETVTARASTAKDHLVRFLYTLFAVAGLSGWAAFWSYVVWMHVRQGDLSSAVITAAVLVVPAIATLVWYVSQGFEFEVPDVDVTARPTAS